MKKPPFQMASSKCRFDCLPLEDTHPQPSCKQEADDRPERELAWIYNPSAPLTTHGLEAFIAEVLKNPNDQKEKS